MTELNSRSHKQYTLIDTPHTWDENILNGSVDLICFSVLKDLVIPATALLLKPSCWTNSDLMYTFYK